MLENTGHRSTIDHIFISDQLCNRLLKYCNMDSAINLSDHSPIMCTLALPNIESILAEGGTVCSHKASDKDRPLKSRYSYRWDRADLQGFYDSTAYLLQTIKPPTHLLAGMYQHVNCPQGNSINAYYHNIVDAFLTSANTHVPKIKSEYLKPYRSDALSDLKFASIGAYNIWINSGRPCFGPINKLLLDCKYKYKSAIKNAALEFEPNLDDEISQLYLKRDMNKFWNKWNSQFSKHS